ncbi:MAG: hypothetical protein AMXMBFR47_28410 [Planctomycetota bacterium]
MKPPFLREFFAFSDWANNRLMQLSAGLPDRDLDRPFEMGPGSLRKTLNHLWAAERVWFDRWKGSAEPFYRAEPCRGPLSGLADDFRALALERNEFLASKTAADLDERVRYRSLRGDAYEHRLGELALHVCNHGVHHRAQAINMLRHLGVELPRPGLDYIFMRLEMGPTAAPPALDRASLKTYFHYSDWARHRIYASAAHLSDVQLDRTFQLGVGSIRRTLMHIRFAEQWWLDNWVLGPGNPFPETPETTSIADLTQLFDETVAARNAFIDRISDEDLLKPVHAIPRPDVERVFPLGVTMLQLCCHGTHHRAQCLNMLRHVGATAPPLDVAVLLREANPVPIEHA